MASLSFSECKSYWQSKESAVCILSGFAFISPTLLCGWTLSSGGFGTAEDDVSRSREECSLGSTVSPAFISCYCSNTHWRAQSIGGSDICHPGPQSICLNVCVSCGDNGEGPIPECSSFWRFFSWVYLLSPPKK